eukprot:CAMPEP_0201687762 /NCGR_PEP_ID=MMETSP0578-20130828/1669_1 /ASSEMBLY_ACC=CAM_ASM_000663 /TAXON_ID=267565 /ORGANISM="Skeletonema grethea, Strain CCMP 1804" /LENGTH=522 /DNA_ID=CAMNT_0048171937 /DNA_START=199 /DNA_END=1767 /DNA_ORIENTATION=-
MKLTFTTSLLLLTAASASSTDGGGLRTRRLSLFSTEASGKKEEKATRWLAKGGKADDDDGEGDDPSNKSNPDSKSGKGEKSGNILGGAKSSKSEFLKTEKARPYSGISTDDDLYYFGETITGAFELDEDILSEDALSNLNVTHIEEFKFALYPYMGRPNCDGNDPIREVAAVFAEGGTEDPIDFEGSFEFSTDVAMKEEAGTGYDLFLLDESCNILLGPEAITITLTPEAQEAEDVAAKAKASKANTPRAKAEKDKTAPVKTYKKKKEKIDSEKITVKSKPALSSDDYELSTDKEEYETGETITVSYNIIAAPAAPDGGVPTSESRRILKKKKKKGKKGDDDEEEEEPEIPEDFGVVEELTEDDAASKPQPEVTADEPVEESAEKEKPVPDQPEPETIIQPDPMVSEDEEESDGELQTEMAAPDDLALEEEEESDPSDITKYSLGVFMKMANPQGGKLPPLYEVPLCATDSCSPADISSGEITISVDSLDTSKFGLGYDLWLLDGSGDGMAGPVFFSIDIDA